MVMGKKMKTCLGDLFSVNWMEDTDAEDISKETFSAQFTKVKGLTTKSHVTQFGEMSLAQDFLKDFMSKAGATFQQQKTIPFTMKNKDKVINN